MATVTTTHYVPNEDGWSNRGFYFRLKVVQVYDNVANASTLTVSLESYHATYSGTFNFLDNSGDPAYIKADGNTLVTLGTSYKFKYAASTTWQQMTSSNATTWTYTVSHDSSGNATVNFETAGRIYLYTGGTEYYGDMDKTMSYTFTGVRAFSLSMSAGDGSTITVKRGGEALSHGAVIYYGDVLTITFGASTGYDLVDHTVNGSNFTSGGTHTVSAAVTVVATATRKSYTLTLTTDGHCALTVTRNGSALASGDTIYYGDSLNISFSAQPGYEVKSAMLNGSEITSPYTHRVTGNVEIVIITALLSSAWIYINGAFKRYFINIYTQGAWRRCREKIFPGGGTGQQAICGQALCGTIKCGGDT